MFSSLRYAPSTTRGMIARCLLAAGCLALSPGALALDPRTAPDRYSIDGWFTEEGLPSTRLRAVHQTRDGYLWLATAQGIARFDGVHFTVYNQGNRRDLAASNFFDIAEAPDGSLWFGANFGLFHYRDGHFRLYDKATGMPDRYVRSLAFTRDGRLVAGTTRGPVFLRDGKVIPHGAEAEWQKVTDNVRSIRGIVELPDGSFLFAAAMGLFHQQGAVLTRISGTGGLPEAAYTALLRESDGTIWIGTSVGLIRQGLDGSLTHVGPDEGLSTPSVECIYRDRDRNLWIGTTGGLYCLRDGKVLAAKYPDAFGASLVGSVRESSEGALWVVSNAGLYRLKNKPADAIGQEEGLENTVVNTMIERRDGSYLIGLWSGGLYRYAEGRATHIGELSDIRAAVYALYEETDGTVWVGAEYGLHRWRDGKLDSFYSAEKVESWKKQLAENPKAALPGLVDSRVYCVLPDGAGGHWVGTIGALYHRRPDDTFEVVIAGSNLTVRSVIRTRNGDLWAGTAAGAYRLRDGQWRLYSKADGLPPTSARMMFEDSEGTIWALTPGFGILRFKDERWTVYTSRQGLIDDTVVSMMEDEQGYFWFGSSRGIMRVRRQSFAELDAGRIASLPQQTFTRNDGLPDSDCTEWGSPNVWKTRSGRILFPTNRGIAIIKPEEAVFNAKPPATLVERIVVDGVDHEASPGVSIAPGARDIAVHFTATSLLAPEKVQFKTRLSPLDRDWSKPVRRREMHFTRLPPGDYVFHVQASNDDGVWNEKGAALAFTVQPFFYQTWWFRLAVVAVIGGAGTAAYLRRLRRLRQRALELQRQNIELERRVAERTAELAKSYETLRASEYFYHSLVESLPQIIARKDADGRFTYVNSAFGELHTIPTEQIVGKTDFDLYPKEAAIKFRADDQHIMDTRQVMEYENVVERPTGKKYMHVKKVPLYDDRGQSIGVQVLFWDMTVFRETEEKLKLAQKELVETSRLAGIAEVATGVLHNIGNALNSVNTSASVALERIRGQKTPSLARVAQLLLEQGDRITDFFANDPRAKQLPTYLAKLEETLTGERDSAATELQSLQHNIEHIKQIVAAQQSHARVSGLTEVVPPGELIEYAVRISEASLQRHGVVVTREFMPVPDVKVERQKALQILVNLVRNAREAVAHHEHGARQITLGLRSSASGTVQILVSDNGVGIAPENLTRIFAFGFTTKKDGHGFGLHSSANAAKEMGGSLIARSEGPGKGATFVLELPANVHPAPAVAAEAVTAG